MVLLLSLASKQCNEVSLVFDELHVGIVLISPMRRALETAYHIFKKHPNFDINKLTFGIK